VIIQMHYLTGVADLGDPFKQRVSEQSGVAVAPGARAQREDLHAHTAVELADRSATGHSSAIRSCMRDRSSLPGLDVPVGLGLDSLRLRNRLARLRVPPIDERCEIEVRDRRRPSKRRADELLDLAQAVAQRVRV
jgi:hypothetical protein